MTSAGTIVSVCYVREGFAFATDSIAYMKGHPPLLVQKLFKITNRLGCAQIGLSHFENDETGETLSLMHAAINRVSTLRTSSATDAIQNVVKAYLESVKDAQRRLGAKLKFQKVKYAELMFAGFDAHTPILVRVHFRRKGERLKEPRIDTRTLNQPTQYLHSGIGVPDNIDDYLDNRTFSELLKHIAWGGKDLPEHFSLNQAIEIVETYVRAAIAAGSPKVGGKPQVAKIPTDGEFTFVVPPEA